MINYELAKELKDAGFPPNDKHRRRVCKHNQVPLLCPNGCQKEDIETIPTLSELIEACGERLVGMSKYENGVYLDGKWTVAYRKEMMSMSSYVRGDTLEEAVARLWLALHAKDCKENPEGPYCVCHRNSSA